jgi:hypothetical protein
VAVNEKPGAFFGGFIIFAKDIDAMGSFSTTRGLHGPEISIRAITPMTMKAAIIGQRILLIEFSLAKNS